MRRTFSLFASSEAGSGAQNISPLGSGFDVFFPQAIQIPAAATNIELSAINATVWWTTPNITAGINDRFRANIEGQPIDAVVAPGLYDLSALQAAIRGLMINAGVTAVYAANNFSLTPDNATQRVQVYLPGPSPDVIHVGDATCVFSLCGFPTGSPDVTTAMPITLSPDKATFNRIDYFLVHSTLAPQGIRFNGVYDSIIAKVPIDVPPGSQITFSPLNPPICNPMELAGATISRARFWLTDQRNVEIDTFGESWSVGITVAYDM